MQAYRIAAYGSIDGLERFETDEPRPGFGQILVRIRACSLNYRDLLVVKGAYGGEAKPGLVPLSDGAGEVVSVGDGVTRFKPGDRVAGGFFDAWQGGPLTTSAGRTARGGGGFGGVLAEHVAMSEQGAVGIPDDLSFEEAATLPCAALTAWHALVPFGQVMPGEIVLTQGTGGVSVFAVLFAKLLGARVFATSSSDQKLERVRDLGADETINYRAHPEWHEEVKRRAGGLGAALVVEVGGPGTFGRSMLAAARGGRIAVIGLLSGAGETIDPLLILRRMLRVEGLLVGSTTMFEAMNRAIASGGVKPVIDRVFPFDEAKQAYAHLEGQNHFGKVVVSLP